MKRIITKRILCSLCAALLLCLLGCDSNTPDPKPSSTVPKNTKTVFVHTSITQNSANMDARTEYIYDENDLLKEVIQYSGTIQTRLYQVENDENGNFTRWHCTVGSTDLTIDYEYDAEGHSTATAYYQNGELMTSLRYTYEEGFRTAMISTMPAQNSESRTEYIYNSQGAMVRQDQFVNGSLSRYGICSTDEQQRLVKIAFYLPSGTPDATAVYTYDGLTQTCVLIDGISTVLSKTVTTYDEFGNLLQVQAFDASGALVSTETHTWKAIEVPLDCPRASV